MRGITKGQKKIGEYNMSIILIMIMVSCMNTNVKMYQMVHFKCVQFVCELYLNIYIYLLSISYILFISIHIVTSTFISCTYGNVKSH